MNKTHANNGQRRLIPRHTRVAGRVRFQAAGLYRADMLAESVEAELQALAGVRSVQINVLTASLLVQFDPALPLEQLRADLEHKLAELQPSLPARPRRKNASDPPAKKSPPASVPAKKNTVAWHALSTQDVLARLDSAETGLSTTNCEARLAEIGENALPKAQKRSDLSLLLEQLVTPPVLLLGVSAAISVATGGVLDAVVIVSVVTINALIGFATERQSEQTIAALTPTESHQALTLRDGDWQRIDVETLVPGDVVTLTPGSIVPADARLLKSERLSLDESALTGESMPTEKEAGHTCQPDVTLGDRRNMAHMGTLVTGGSGLGVIVSTGLNTEIGQIQAMAESARPPATAAEQQLDAMGTQLAWLSSGVCVAVFGVGLLRGFGWLEMLKASIALAVAAVPEGLPTVATTTLAIGIQNMRRRNVLARRMDAVETLGSVQVFCLDKTGTLTLNHMTVVELYVDGQRIDVDANGFWLSGRTLDPLSLPTCRHLCEVTCLCSEAEFDDTAAEPRIQGSATEQALVELALQAGVAVAELRQTQPRLDIQHRAEDRPYMVTWHELPDGRRLVAVKGSPEALLKLCRWRLDEGQRHPLDDATRKTILYENERMAGEALRVLGAAFALTDGDSDALDDLVWLGLAGMIDPLRPGMKELLARFHHAGIETAIITGDQSATAYAIARELDVAGGEQVEMLDAVALEKEDPELLSSVVRGVQVFSRVSPANKLQIVQALQQAGKIVAMTGDGVNDSPALKAANLGVAMGGSGSEVARSVADVVIEDDDLTTMIIAVRDGRTIYDNIRKAIRFLLATNLSEIELMLAGIALGLGQPLNPMQLLWINLFTDIFPGLALAMEKSEPDVLERPPRDPQQRILETRNLGRLGVESMVLAGGALAGYLDAMRRYGPGMQANTQAFMTLTLGQLLHAISCRSEERVLLQRLPRNRYLEIALGVSISAQVLTVFVPGLRGLLGTAPLGLRDWLAVGVGAGLPLLLNEATKSTSAKRKTSSQESPS